MYYLLNHLLVNMREFVFTIKRALVVLIMFLRATFSKLLMFLKKLAMKVGEALIICLEGAVYKSSLHRLVRKAKITRLYYWVVSNTMSGVSYALFEHISSDMPEFDYEGHPLEIKFVKSRVGDDADIEALVAEIETAMSTQQSKIIGPFKSCAEARKYKKQAIAMATEMVAYE